MVSHSGCRQWQSWERRAARVTAVNAVAALAVGDLKDVEISGDLEQERSSS